MLAAAQSGSEKAGSSSSPPALSKNRPETFSRVSSPSFPLLRKLRVPSKLKAKWSKKGKQPEPEQEQDQGVEETEEENDDESILVRSDAESDNDYLSSLDTDDSRWRTIWRKVRFYLPNINYRFPTYYIGFHHVLMIISAVAITLLSLLLAGCSSHRMRNIYLLELSYDRNSSLTQGPGTSNPLFYSLVANLSSATDLTIRVGYFGVCMATHTEDDSSLSWSCRSKAKDLNGQVTALQDPLNLLAIGDNFQDEIILSVILIMSIILMVVALYLLSTFPGWHEEVDAAGEEVELKPFPSRAVAAFVQATHVLAALFLMVAILWQHIAVVAHSATTEAVFKGAVRGDVGAVAMGFGWGALGMNVIVVLGLIVMNLNLRLLAELTEDDDSV